MTKPNFLKKCTELYEKDGQSAVFNYVNKLDKPSLKLLQLKWEYCNGCECDSPSIKHECVVCGQETKKSTKSELLFDAVLSKNEIARKVAKFKRDGKDGVLPVEYIMYRLMEIERVIGQANQPSVKNIFEHITHGEKGEI